MKRIYRTLLHLYPADYHARSASEVTAAFIAAAESHGHRSRFLISELRGLLIGAAREWRAKLTSSPLIRARTLPDIRKMRPAGVSREAWFSDSR